MPVVCLILLAANTFTTIVDAAFELFETGQYREAAAALDAAAVLEPDRFDVNNLHYLRGRIAESEQDWDGAEAAFARVRIDSPLHGPAEAHRIRIALARGAVDDAEALFESLPPGYPDGLRLELAGLAPEEIALRIYDSSNSRLARWNRAEMRQDEQLMWRLLRSNRNDEFALEAARRLDRSGLTADERILLAETFGRHRVFDRAEALWTSLLEDPSYGAEAHYQLGRVYFLTGRYDAARGVFRTTMIRFPDTSWAKESEGQIATTYWRQLDFETAAGAYRALIERQGDGDRRLYHSAVRDLVDIYRSSGDGPEALALIETALENSPSSTDRAVLTFTRAKIHLQDARFASALEDLLELERMNLRPVPNSTDRTEIRFFRALTLEQLGRTDEAGAIWTELSRNPFSYYGLKAIEKLNERETWESDLWRTVRSTIDDLPGGLCLRGTERNAREAARVRRLDASRDFREEAGGADLVGELAFLRLWDEAFVWATLAPNRWNDQALADLAFLASDFRRAMLYADRLPRPGSPDLVRSGLDDLLAMLYPTGFGEIVCRESRAAGVNPLWLQSIIWQESRYDPRARSGAAARGLMQFIPETAAEVSAALGEASFDVDSLYRPEVSIRLGAHYWAGLLEEMKHPEMALAAYNGGPLNVQRWRAKSGGNPDLFVADIGFVETKNYVRQVFELYAKYAYLSITASSDTTPDSFVGAGATRGGSTSENTTSVVD